MFVVLLILNNCESLSVSVVLSGNVCSAVASSAASASPSRGLLALSYNLAFLALGRSLLLFSRCALLLFGLLMVDHNSDWSLRCKESLSLRCGHRCDESVKV